VLINQSTVVANRSIVGFPYEIRQPGSYQLSSNLKVPPGVNGIKISASFVSLDLNGFNISCVGGCSGSAGNGITDSGTGFDNDGTPQSGITIRNGAVVGFFFGIDLGGSSGSFIEKVTAQSNGFVGIAVGNSSIVKDCLSLNNGGDGIVAGLHGIVSGNVVSGNAGLNAAPETSTRLLFSFVTNAGGYETGLEIANISVDPTIGSKATQGTCALNFFGTGSNILPAPIQSFVTPTLPGGTVYTSTLSVITSASNFSGYVIALCNFKAQGAAFIAVNATVTAAIPAVVNP
jgi:parallel beta-helix repeat protein